MSPASEADGKETFVPPAVLERSAGSLRPPFRGPSPLGLQQAHGHQQVRCLVTAASSVAVFSRELKWQKGPGAPGPLWHRLCPRDLSASRRPHLPAPPWGQHLGVSLLGTRHSVDGSPKARVWPHTKHCARHTLTGQSWALAHPEIRGVGPQELSPQQGCELPAGSQGEGCPCWAPGGCGHAQQPLLSQKHTDCTSASAGAACPTGQSAHIPLAAALLCRSPCGAAGRVEARRRV